MGVVQGAASAGGASAASVTLELPFASGGAETITGPWGGMPGEVFYPEKGVQSETRRVPLGLPGDWEKRFFRLQVKRLAE